MRCEGYRRRGGALTLGPVRWEQCNNEAIVILTVKQEKIEKLPSCSICWQECINNKIQINSVDPISKEVEK